MERLLLGLDLFVAFDLPIARLFRKPRDAQVVFAGVVLGISVLSKRLGVSEGALIIDVPWPKICNGCALQLVVHF